MMPTCAIHARVDPTTLSTMPTYARSSIFYPNSLVCDAIKEHDDKERRISSANLRPNYLDFPYFSFFILFSCFNEDNQILKFERCRICFDSQLVYVLFVSILNCSLL